MRLQAVDARRRNSSNSRTANLAWTMEPSPRCQKETVSNRSQLARTAATLVKVVSNSNRTKHLNNECRRIKLNNQTINSNRRRIQPLNPSTTPTISRTSKADTIPTQLRSRSWNVRKYDEKCCEEVRRKKFVIINCAIIARDENLRRGSHTTPKWLSVIKCDIFKIMTPRPFEESVACYVTKVVKNVASGQVLGFEEKEREQKRLWNV